jgi:hypothetical protein
MVKIEIRTSDTGSFFDLEGDVTIGLTNEQYQNLILVDAKPNQINGYFLKYEKLRCVISDADAEKLIKLGAKVEKYLD